MPAKDARDDIAFNLSKNEAHVSAKMGRELFGSYVRCPWVPGLHSVAVFVEPYFLLLHYLILPFRIFWMWMSLLTNKLGICDN